MHVLSSVIAASSGGGSIVSFLFLPLIFVAMYFLMIRPQRRRQRQAATLQREIEIGDEIMTTSGIYGFVTGFEGDVAWLDIDDNVQIRVARAAIQRRVDTAVDADEADADAKPRHTNIADAIETGAVDRSDDEAAK